MPEAPRANASPAQSVGAGVGAQARALVAAYSCVGGDSSKCGVWRPLMDQALALHNNISSECGSLRAGRPIKLTYTALCATAIHDYDA